MNSLKYYLSDVIEPQQRSNKSRRTNIDLHIEKHWNIAFRLQIEPAVEIQAK